MHWRKIEGLLKPEKGKAYLVYQDRRPYMTGPDCVSWVYWNSGYWSLMETGDHADGATPFNCEPTHYMDIELP